MLSGKSLKKCDAAAGASVLKGRRKIDMKKKFVKKALPAWLLSAVLMSAGVLSADAAQYTAFEQESDAAGRYLGEEYGEEDDYYEEDGGGEDDYNEDNYNEDNYNEDDYSEDDGGDVTDAGNGEDSGEDEDDGGAYDGTWFGSSSYDYRDIIDLLGDAVDYGIIADTLVSYSALGSNAAVNTYVTSGTDGRLCAGTSDGFGNLIGSYENEDGAEPGSDYWGAGGAVFGSDAYDRVDSLRSEAAGASYALADAADSDSVKVFNAMGNSGELSSDLGAAGYDVSAAVYDYECLVINIDTEGADSYTVTGLGIDSDRASHVVINLLDRSDGENSLYGGTVYISGTVCGTMLASSAYVVLDGTMVGAAAASSFECAGGSFTKRTLETREAPLAVNLEDTEEEDGLPEQSDGVENDELQEISDDESSVSRQNESAESTAAAASSEEDIEWSIPEAVDVTVIPESETEAAAEPESETDGEAEPESTADTGSETDGAAEPESTADTESRTDGEAEGGDSTDSEVGTESEETDTAGGTESVSQEVIPAQAEILVRQEMEGRQAGTEDTFGFRLTAVYGENEAGEELACPMPESDYTATAGSENGTFGTLIFEEPGTYYYTAAEEEGELSGVSYDTSSHSIEIIVSESDEDNRLNAQVLYEEEADAAIAVNYYEEPEPVSEEVRIKIIVKAILENREWQEGDSFTFDLAALDAYDEEGNELEVPMPGSSVLTETASEKRTFGSIGYTVPGVYRYIVTERQGELDRVVYDTAEHIITVSVEKDENGELTAQVKADTGKRTLEVVNVYQRQISGTASFKIKKNLEGRSWNEDDAFTFLIDADDDTPLPKTTGGKTIHQYTLHDGKARSIGTITFSEPGEYVYTVTEKIPEGAHDNGDGTWTSGGITYDGTEHVIVITMADEGGDSLTAHYTYDGEELSALTVTNTYDAAGSKKLYVQKELVGRKWQEGDAFTFDIAAKSAVNSSGENVNAPMPENLSITVTDAEPAAFGTIKFREAGVYTYVITERQGSLANMTYDTTAHKVTVVVSDPDGSGKLTASVEYDGGGTAQHIRNVYTSPQATGTGEIFIQKNLVGRDWEDGDEFTFRIAAGSSEDTDGNAVNTPMPEIDTISVYGSAPVSFGRITYRKAGVYRYKIGEAVPSDAVNNGDGTYTKNGMTYDASAHYVVVYVSNNGGEHLSVEVTYDNGENAQVITNTYDRYNRSGSVKTGDTNPIQLYVLLMAGAAAAVLIVLLLMKRRR